MGACSFGRSCPYAEQIPPEYLSRFRPLRNHHGVEPAPMGLAAPSVFADLLGLRYSSRRLWSDHGCAMAMLLARASEAWEEMPGGFNSPSIRKKRRRPSVPASAFRPLRRRGIAPTSHIALLIRRQLSFSGFAGLRKGQNARAGNWARRKIDVEAIFLAWLRFQ